MKLRALAEALLEAVKLYEQEHAAAGVEVPDLDDTLPSSLDEKSASCPSTAAFEARATIQACAGELLARTSRPQLYVTEMDLSFLMTAALQVAINAKLEQTLSPHSDGLTTKEIAEATNTHDNKIGRILRFLASRHVFREVSEDKFASNRMSAVLPQLENVMSHWHDDMFASAAELANTVLDPQTAKDVTPNAAAAARHFGFPAFEFFAKEPHRGVRFAKAMIEVTKALGYTTFADDYPWADVGGDDTVFVDVGGGVGTLAKLIAAALPHWKFIIQDQKSQLDEAPEFWTDLPNAKVEFQLHDFFKPQPVRDADVFLLRAILHDWPDKECVTILKNLRAAAKATTRLIVDEFVVLPATRQGDSLVLDNKGYAHQWVGSLDMNMLVALNAQERTRSQFERLFTESGWKLNKIYPLTNGQRRLIEALPA